MNREVRPGSHFQHQPVPLPPSLINHTVYVDTSQSPGEIKRREVSWTLSKNLDAFAGPGEIKRREVSWTLTKKLDALAGPGEIKRREAVLDPQAGTEEIKSREVKLGLRAGLLLLQLFPNGGATDIVFATLFCIAAVGTAIAWYGSCCAMPVSYTHLTLPTKTLV